MTNMNMNGWQQAQLLMQPAFIRLIDNIRKQLDHSDWTGSYRTTEIWPEGTTSEVQATVAQLQQQLETATPEQSVELTQTLAQLPQPELVYQLCLKKENYQVEVNLWELCYQVCFRHYNSPLESAAEAIQVDTDLIDASGEVDWHRLD
ncbi:MAG TPA: hypothetical protein V6D03_10575, partial [Candidatus Caenarcaniphilales bacterium]